MRLTKISSINGYKVVVAKADVCGRKFYAEAEHNEEYYFANVYEDRGAFGTKHICHIDFAEHCGSNAVMHILCGVLGGISSHYGKRRRRLFNKRNRLDLSIDREIAATV